MISTSDTSVIDDKKNTVRIDIQSLTQEPIDVYSNSSTISEKPRSGSRWERFIDSFREMERPEIDTNSFQNCTFSITA